jgi:hypothetical protein
MLSAVADSSPPRMTTPIGAWISLPGWSPASTSGISARPAHNAVIRIGESLSIEPRTTASSSVVPSTSVRHFLALHEPLLEQPLERRARGVDRDAALLPDRRVRVQDIGLAVTPQVLEHGELEIAENGQGGHAGTYGGSISDCQSELVRVAYRVGGYSIQP